MEIVVRIPVGGYTPGQTINVEIEADNQSGQKTHFSVQLWKVRMKASHWDRCHLAPFNA